MKIVMVAPSYAPRNGGVEKHILAVNRVLTQLGHEVVVLVRWAKDLPDHQTVEGVEVWRLPQSWSLPALTAWWFAHRRVLGQVDVVHSHDVYPRHLRRLLPGVRWVHTFHGYEGWPLQSSAIESRRSVRAAVDVCFGVGAFIEKWYGTKLDYVTYGAADAAGAVARADNGADVLFVGRLEVDTGFKDYLEGFALIHAKHPEVSLLVAGSGSLAEWAQSYIAEHNLPVTLHGWLDNPAPYLRAARVVFVSGYLAILEAARLGKPVVAHYGTPIKQDYLECHPLAKDLIIVNSAGTVAAGYETAGNFEPKRLKRSQTWAEAQTWQKLASDYLAAYAPR